MKLRRKMFAAVSSLAVLSAALLAGCGAQPSDGTALQETGILTLSVNPEIRIEYNKEGRVTALTGQNEDGKQIVASYQDYIGKECDDVLKDLILEISEAGYFIEDVDGNKKNIVLQLEPGSVLPSDDFLEEMSISTQNAVKGLQLSSGIVTIDDDDYDPAYAQNGAPSPYITLEKAQEIALTQANVDAADAVFDDRDFDHDDGTPVFELEFYANGIEYDYDVDAVTGKVLSATHQELPAGYSDTDYGPNNDGVTDYNDTDYGPNNDGVTDYDDTDYGPNNDGVTDYTAPAESVPEAPASDSSNYGDSNYDDGGSSYSDSDDDDSDDNDGDDDDDDDD